MPRKLTVKTPGAPISAPERAPAVVPNVPESFLAEIAALSDEGLIALDTAERAGENRAEYLDAIDAELKPRIARMAGQGEALTGGQVTAPEPDVAKALNDVIDQVHAGSPGATKSEAAGAVLDVLVRRGPPTPADVNPSKLTTAVLTTEGWILPTTSTPPPIR